MTPNTRVIVYFASYLFFKGRSLIYQILYVVNVLQDSLGHSTAMSKYNLLPVNEWNDTWLAVVTTIHYYYKTTKFIKLPTMYPVKALAISLVGNNCIITGKNALLLFQLLHTKFNKHFLCMFMQIFPNCQIESQSVLNSTIKNYHYLLLQHNGRLLQIVQEKFETHYYVP